MWDAYRDFAPSSSETARQLGGPGRLAHLRRQERQWFAWLTILHERLTKDGQGPPTEESRRVLEIAKNRWLEAKRALASLEQGQPPRERH